MTPETQESVTEEQTVDETVAEETSSPEVTDEGASSSDAAVEDQDFAEVVRDEFLKKYGEPEEEAVTKGDDQPEATPQEPVEASTEQSQEKQEAISETDDGDDEEYRLSDKEFKSLPDGVKKRIGHLNTRVKKTEREMADMQAQLETAKDAETRLGQLRQFAEENRMTPQDVTAGLGIMAKLTSGDFEGFLKDVQPFYDRALQASGKSFAPDLQEQVNNGYLTEEAARTITRSRMEAEMARQESQRVTAKMEQTQQQTQQQAHLNDIVTAVNSREAELRQTDPDYAQKAPAMKRIMEFALSNGATPKNREQAIKMVNDAYEQATAAMPRPAPQPTPPRPSASTVARGKPAPVTLEDALAASPPPAG